MSKTKRENPKINKDRKVHALLNPNFSAMTPPTSGPVRLPRATFAEFMAEMASELFSKLLAMIWLSISLAKGMDGT